MFVHHFQMVTTPLDCIQVKICTSETYLITHGFDFSFSLFLFPSFFFGDVTQLDSHKYSNILTEIGTVDLSLDCRLLSQTDSLFFSLSLSVDPTMDTVCVIVTNAALAPPNPPPPPTFQATSTFSQHFGNACYFTNRGHCWVQLIWMQLSFWCDLGRAAFLKWPL